jgi:hypothetical protein
MPDPFDMSRRLQERAERQARAAERVVARMADAARRRRDAIERQRGRLLERLAGRLGPDGEWTAPSPKPPRRRPGRESEGGGVPAEPNRPNTLSGGAAASVEREES